MFYFYLFNCIFASDTLLPLDLCLLNVQDLNHNILNFIVFKYNSKIIEEITGEKIKIGKCLYKTTNGYLIDKTICKFYININESSIFVFGSGENINIITIYLIGEVLALYFRLKGIFQLHACMLNYNNITIILCGSSGNGKSTLANEFLLNGWNMLCDDHCIINKLNNEIVGIPSFPYMKMFCNENEAKKKELVFKIPDTGKGLYKAYIQANHEMYSNLYKITHIFSLNFERTNMDSDNIECHLLDNFTALEHLLQNSYACLRAYGDFVLLQKSLECISLYNSISKFIPHYQLKFTTKNTPREVMDFIIHVASMLVI